MEPAEILAAISAIRSIITVISRNIEISAGNLTPDQMALINQAFDAMRLEWGERVNRIRQIAAQNG